MLLVALEGPVAPGSSHCWRQCEGARGVGWCCAAQGRVPTKRGVCQLPLLLSGRDQD